MTARKMALMRRSFMLIVDILKGLIVICCFCETFLFLNVDNLFGVR